MKTHRIAVGTRALKTQIQIHFRALNWQGVSEKLSKLKTFQTVINDRIKLERRIRF